MKVYIVAIGKIKERFYQDAIAEYVKRLGKYTKVEILELADIAVNKVNDSEIAISVNKESENILRAVRGIVVLLDISGTLIPSEGLANIINTTMPKGEDICFVIGGSNGVNNDVRKRANYRISFGKVTYPHQLMRVILSEQIYRAYTILNNTPYHK